MVCLIDISGTPAGFFFLFFFRNGRELNLVQRGGGEKRENCKQNVMCEGRLKSWGQIIDKHKLEA